MTRPLGTAGAVGVGFVALSAIAGRIVGVPDSATTDFIA
jgi:hypothetical protein